MEALNHREWLEAIVATGSQRSGFADDALRELDRGSHCDTLLAELVDACGEQGVGIEDDPVRIVTEQVAGYQAVLSLLVEAGVLADDGDATSEQVVGVLRMFVPV